MSSSSHGVLILCTGNVCRSPYVERRLRHELADVAVSVRSAGVRAVVGAPIDPGSAAELEVNGGCSEGFAARQLTPELLEQQDLVLCATRDHRSAAVRLAPRVLNRTFALTDFADLVSHVPTEPDQRLPFDDLAPNALARLARAAARERGAVQPRSEEAAAITDPIGQAEEMFAQMAREIEAVLPPVVYAIRRHVGLRS